MMIYLRFPDDIDHLRHIISIQARRILDQVKILATREAIVFGNAPSFSQFKRWNFSELSQHRLRRKFTIGIRHRLPAMPGHRIKDINRKPIATAQRLDAMTPRMAWSEPLVDDAERLDPPRQYL